jgi:hypothetical protein
MSPPSFRAPTIRISGLMWPCGKTIGSVTQALSEFDPGMRPLYQQNAERYTP